MEKDKVRSDSSLLFKKLEVPGGGVLLIPEDIELVFPNEENVSPNLLHFLVFIPWQDKYLDLVPEDFKAFFKLTLPYLHVRTTDVHIAKCFGYFDEMLDRYPNSHADRRVVGLGLILHDIGWSKLSNEEITLSLGIKGLKLNKEALKPKERHAIEGEKIARKLLGGFGFDPRLSEQKKDLILKAVLYHDKPEEVSKKGKIPDEIKLVVDLDHIWSFTHENFWQDTVRKGIAPQEYFENMRKDLGSYLVTQAGKDVAEKLLQERRKELESYKVFVRDNLK